MSSLHLVADGVKLDGTSPGMQASNIPRDGRMLSTNGGMDLDCNRLPEEMNRIWTTRSGENVAVGRCRI